MKVLQLIVAVWLCLPVYAQWVTQEADIWSGTSSSLPFYFAVDNDTFYFSASSPPYGQQLWMFDGNSYKLAAEIFPGNSSRIRDITVTANGKIVFAAENSFKNQELWGFNGSTAYQLAELASDTGSYPRYMTLYNGLVYFGALSRDSSGSIGRELFVTDGDTVYLFADLYPGVNSSDPSYLKVFNNKLYFRATLPATGNELYSYDGNTVSLVVDLEPGPGGTFPVPMLYFGGELYFSAHKAKGRELYKTDGVNTSIVADINAGADHGIPAFLTEYNGSIYFRATSDIYGTELFSYDGTNLTVYDLKAGVDGSSPQWLKLLDNKLYMSLDDCADSFGLACYPDDVINYDGSAFKNITNMFQGNEPWLFGLYKDKIIMRADDGITGQELWSIQADTPCLAPQNLAASNFKSAGSGSSKALISWDAAVTASSYIVHGGIEGTDPKTAWSTFSVGNNGYNASGLSEICYVWRAQSVCDGDTSLWSGLDTFCVPPCAPPSNLSAAVGSGKVIFNWDPPASSSLAYLLEAKINTGGWGGSFKDTISPGTASTKSYSITSAIPSGQYKWRMLTGCSVSPFRISPYSNVHLFTIPSVSQKGASNEIRIMNYGEYIMVIRDHTDLSGPYHVNIYSIDGKLMYRETTYEAQSKIRIDELATGMYIVEVTNGEDKFVDRLMVW